MTRIGNSIFLGVIIVLVSNTIISAMNMTGGLMTAVPVKNHQPPKIDGTLDDWDLNAAEPVLLSEQTAARFHAEWAAMYDEDALYLSARVSLPNRPYNNPNNPTDGFWWGDILQVRLGADPTLLYPLDSKRDVDNDSVSHISIWKNSETGVDYLNITHGVNLNLGSKNNPRNSQVVIRLEGTNRYIAEVKLPWSSLNVPGGKNPFKPGQKMAFIIETLWTGGDTSRIPAVFKRDPGTFAFRSPQTWGQLEFAVKGFTERRRPTIESLIADLQGKEDAAQKTGVPITIDVPGNGLKTSVNILGPNNEVLRELVGGESYPKGLQTLYWDGKDVWGHTLQPNSYKWGAYFHQPLTIEYAGSAGTSGHPPYSTLDGTGAWGGDHSNPIDCTADDSGLYFLWPVSEAGKAIVKTDYQGKVLWRKTPFVGGGFGPFGAIVTDGNFIYLTLGNQNVRLTKIEASTGKLLTWGESGITELPLYTNSENAHTSEHSILHAPVGLAVRDGRVYISYYEADKVLIVNGDNGTVERELDCPGPRGLAFDSTGNLFAVSHVPGQEGKIIRFENAQNKGITIVSNGLDEPFDVAVDSEGKILLSDLGNSHQIKVFDTHGAFLKSFGKKGGRPWQGTYDPDAFLNPAGIAIDNKDALLVAESSPPKVISRLNIENGEIINRWYGPGIYWNSTWPMPEDPQWVFYTLPGAIGRARVAPVGEVGVPDAYWVPNKAGYPEVESLEAGIPQLETVRADNGELYMAHDTVDHAIFLMRDDLLRPVATWRRADNNQGIHVWSDENGDGKPQTGETSLLTKLANGQPMPRIAEKTSSMHMEPNGDLYFTTQDNCILKIPATGFGQNGMIRWNTGKAVLAIPEVLPGHENMHTTWRHGLRGIQVASNGDLYVVFNTTVPGEGRAFDYVSPEMATHMKNGLGHTSTFNIVKFAKFNSNGKLLWMTGRKAVSGAKPGEIYHTWNIAGLINDRYVASGSEWGTISLYTHDGFYVDSLMNNPANAALPGPYTFGGETSGARVQYFPQLDETWAYSTGRAYQIHGLKKGVILDESRVYGTVDLDKTYNTPVAEKKQFTGAMKMVRVTQNPLEYPDEWNPIPTNPVMREDKQLAITQLAYDDLHLYVRIHVIDSTPLENGADQIALALKGGDTAGIVLGKEKHTESGHGDVRIMAAQINGKASLIGMKTVTDNAMKPFKYITAQSAHFDFVDEISNGQVQLIPDTDGKGYTALFAVPRTFLEFDFTSGSTLHGDIEVRLSGTGSRGLQVTERCYLFTPARPETTMVDDVPTEARMYPKYWGTIKVN